MVAGPSLLMDAMRATLVDNKILACNPLTRTFATSNGDVVSVEAASPFAGSMKMAELTDNPYAITDRVILDVRLVMSPAFSNADRTWHILIQINVRLNEKLPPGWITLIESKAYDSTEFAKQTSKNEVPWPHNILRTPGRQILRQAMEEVSND